ncbi:MAG: Gfo/Idh/MocA family protein [Actinomycetales bacterium]
MATSDQQAPSEGRIRWGVIGTGGIAGKFAKDLQLLPDAELVAVGSRAQATADAFGDTWGAPRRYPSYAELVGDPDVDAVYVSTPHPMHRDDALLAIEAGKAVLCEKAFTINAAQARELVEAARARGVFLMEAMWTRFLPHMVKVREVIASGVLGSIRSVYADHGQWFEEDPDFRLFASVLGGGALLDLGVYPISFASMVLGPPARVTAVSDPAFTGVDAQTSMILQYDGGAQAVLTCTLEARSTVRAAVIGTDGRIEIDWVWYQPTTFRVITRAGEVTEYDEPCEPRGMQHEAAEVGRCLRSGLLESPTLPLDETVSIMETMDEVRRQIGLRYPGE